MHEETTTPKLALGNTIHPEKQNSLTKPHLNHTPKFNHLHMNSPLHRPNFEYSMYKSDKSLIDAVNDLKFEKKKEQEMAERNKYLKF